MRLEYQIGNQKLPDILNDFIFCNEDHLREDPCQPASCLVHWAPEPVEQDRAIYQRGLFIYGLSMHIHIQHLSLGRNGADSTTEY